MMNMSRVHLVSLLLSVVFGFSSGAAALQIRRVGLSQMPGLSGEAGIPNDTLSYPLLQYLPLAQDRENHTYQHEDSTVTQHSHQDEFAYPQHHHQQELLSSFASPAVSPQLTQKNLRVCPTEIGIKLKEVSSTIVLTSFVTRPMPVYTTNMSHVTVTSVTPVTFTVTTFKTPHASVVVLSTTKVVNTSVTVQSPSFVTTTHLLTNTEVLVHTITSTTVLTTLTTHLITLPLTHHLTARQTVTTPTLLTFTESLTRIVTTSQTALVTKHARLRVADVKLVTETERLTQSFTATSTYYVQAIRAAC